MAMYEYPLSNLDEVIKGLYKKNGSPAILFEFFSKKPKPFLTNLLCREKNKKSSLTYLAIWLNYQ
ncbi:hypothetical protein JW877_07915 [bacterium]|nr:hypothetical protein [bacterium]